MNDGKVGGLKPGSDCPSVEASLGKVLNPKLLLLGLVALCMAAVAICMCAMVHIMRMMPYKCSRFTISIAKQLIQTVHTALNPITFAFFPPALVAASHSPKVSQK